MFKQLLSKGITGEPFTEAEATVLMDAMMTGAATESQIASLLTILRLRGETVEELIGFVKSMRNHALPFSTPFADVVDTCGTGGDGARTFNISTAAAIVMAAVGVKVAKHGNRKVSSNSGSADVLEHLGIPIQMDKGDAIHALKEHSMCFLYAPTYHPAMKNAVKPRQEVGFRTVFNLLGPLCNPAQCTRQLIGVSDPISAGKIAKVVQKTGSERVMIVSGDDGLDECSITTTTTLLDVRPNSIEKVQIDPTEFGLEKGKLEDLTISSAAESAQMIQSVFKRTANNAAQHIVILNAALGLVVAGKVPTIQGGVQLVKQAIDSGQVWNHYVNMSDSSERTYVYA